MISIQQQPTARMISTTASQMQGTKPDPLGWPLPDNSARALLVHPRPDNSDGGLDAAVSQ